MAPGKRTVPVLKHVPRTGRSRPPSSLQSQAAGSSHRQHLLSRGSFRKTVLETRRVSVETKGAWRRRKFELGPLDGDCSVSRVTTLLRVSILDAYMSSFRSTIVLGRLGSLEVPPCRTYVHKLNDDTFTLYFCQIADAIPTRNTHYCCIAIPCSWKGLISSQGGVLTPAVVHQRTPLLLSVVDRQTSHWVAGQQSYLPCCERGICLAGNHKTPVY